MEHSAVFGLDPKIVSTVILLVSYLILFTEKMNRAVVALLGAVAMIFAGVLTQETAIAGIDFNTLALLIGMMIIVGIAEKSGMFQYVAVWSAKKVRASPRGLLIVLAAVTAVFSALLDNVTTVLLIVPITFEITRKLKINPYPYLILEIFASNIGGTATLIGDPPNILIGSALQLSFMDFVYELTPVVIITMVVLIAAFDLICGRRMSASEQDRQAVMQLNEKEAITDRRLLHKSLTVGAAVLLLLYTFGDRHDEREHKVEEAFGLVDWTTIFFFAGLFAIVYGLEESGVLALMGHKFIEITDGSIQKASMIVVWLSAFVSTAIDNIPFVATMIPMIKSMEASLGGREAMMPVWWALSLGACFGGNGSLIAASANVIVAGMAQREGHPIHFMRFLIWSIPVMLISVLIATIYLHIRWFAN